MRKKGPTPNLQRRKLIEKNYKDNNIADNSGSNSYFDKADKKSSDKENL